MNDMKKFCKVIVLPESRPTCVGLIRCIKDWKSEIFPEDFSLVGDIHIGKNVSKGVFEFWEPCHILFVTDDKIESGDTYLDDINQIRTAFTSDSSYWSTRKNYKKIVAASSAWIDVPMISDSWIRESFVASNGRITSVELEMEEQFDNYSYGELTTKIGIKLTSNDEVVVSTYSEDKGYKLINLGPSQPCALNIEKEDGCPTSIEKYNNAVKEIREGFLTGDRQEEMIDLLKKPTDQKVNPPNYWTTGQMLEAIAYGFKYHRDSMHNDIDVPEGNKLQWLLGFIDPLKHKEAIESWKNDNKLS